MDKAIRVRILNEAVYISPNDNNFENGRHPIILAQTIG